MIDILSAAHIAQLEANLRNTNDWRHDPLRVSRFRLVMLVVVFGAMSVGTLAGLYPHPVRPGLAVAAIPEQEISAPAVGSGSRQPSH